MYNFCSMTSRDKKQALVLGKEVVLQGKIGNLAITIFSEFCAKRHLIPFLQRSCFDFNFICTYWRSLLQSFYVNLHTEQPGSTVVLHSCSIGFDPINSSEKAAAPVLRSWQLVIRSATSCCRRQVIGYSLLVGASSSVAPPKKSRRFQRQLGRRQHQGTIQQPLEGSLPRCKDLGTIRVEAEVGVVFVEDRIGTKIRQMFPVSIKLSPARLSHLYWKLISQQGARSREL